MKLDIFHIHSHSTSVIETTKSYDYNNRLTEIESQTSAFTVSRHEYSHTALNQRSRVDLKDGSYWLYEYNSKGEVIKGERYDASNVLITGQGFGYSFDGIGNREDTTLDSIAKAAYSANALNQYTSITTPTPTTRTLLHDADGNLIDDGTYLYEWDGENRLNIVRQKSDHRFANEYAYDYQGRRMFMLLEGGNFAPTLFYWDGWNLVYQRNPISHKARQFIWGLDLSGSQQGAGGVGGLLAQKVEDNTHHFMAYDGNGNVTEMVNASTGLISASYEYGPFGESISVTGSEAENNRFRFSTKYTDKLTEHLYYGYRYYNPEDGRWLSRDPIEESGGLNLYGMVGNNSIDYIDLFGLRDVVISIASAPHIKKGSTHLNESMKKEALIQFGFTPDKYYYTLEVPLVTEKVINAWKNRALVEHEKVTGKKCCNDIKINFSFTRDINSIRQHFSTRADAYVIFGHGEKAHTNETGIILTLGTPLIEGRPQRVGAPIGLQDIFGNWAPEQGELYVGSCHDKGLARQVNKTTILRLGGDVDRINYVHEFAEKFKNIIKSSCCDSGD